MLIPKIIYNRIDEIIEREYLVFMFSLIGDDFLSETQKRQLEVLGLIIGVRPMIELLYMLIRNRPNAGYADIPLQQLLDKIHSQNILPVLNDSQQATLDDAKAAFMDSIDATKSELKKQIKQRISKINKEYKRDITVRRYVNVSHEREKQINYVGALLLTIAGIGASIQSNFVRGFTTNLTDFINDSTIDQATSEAVMTGIPTTDIVVYKKVVDDDSLCQWCRKFYTHKDGTPIKYSLSTLQANGSNEGKPKSEWKPTIPSTHPRCRCQLQYLR
jgi:hypothetical protein